MFSLPRISLLLTLICISSAVLANLPDGNTLIKAINKLDEGKQATRNLHMKLVDRRGKVRERETITYKKIYGDDKKTVVFFLQPTNVKNTGFLTFDYADSNKEDDQWLYLPALRKVRRISASDRGDYFLGTDFTYEDIKKEGKIEINDYYFKTLGQEKLNGLDVYKVEATVKNEKIAKDLGHSKLTLFIDKANNVVMESIFYDLNGNKLKTVKITELKQINGIWTREKLEAHNHKTGHKTYFNFSNTDYQTNISDRLFTKQALRKGA